MHLHIYFRTSLISLFFILYHRHVNVWLNSHSHLNGFVLWNAFVECKFFLATSHPYSSCTMAHQTRFLDGPPYSQTCQQCLWIFILCHLWILCLCRCLPVISISVNVDDRMLAVVCDNRLHFSVICRHTLTSKNIYSSFVVSIKYVRGIWTKSYCFALYHKNQWSISHRIIFLIMWDQCGVITTHYIFLSPNTKLWRNINTWARIVQIPQTSRGIWTRKETNYNFVT